VYPSYGYGYGYPVYSNYSSGYYRSQNVIGVSGRGFSVRLGF
jgi:hypothetical protein